MEGTPGSNPDLFTAFLGKLKRQGRWAFKYVSRDVDINLVPWPERRSLRSVVHGGQMRRKYMPVLLLWAVPAVIVVGGVGYYLVRAVH